MTKTFTVNSYKGCREVSLQPTGSLVVIAGANGAGKSSFIDAIAELFDPRGTKLTPKPIHEGADEASAEYLDTELDLRITRTWAKNDAGKLQVEALDGAKYQRPAEVVADLTGGMLFDPVQFLNMDEKKQRDALLAKVDLPIDLDALARQKAGAESRRLDAGRDIKKLRGALATMPKPAPDLPDAEQSMTAAVADYEKAVNHNREIDHALSVVEGIDQAIDELRRQIAVAEQRRSDATDVAARDKVDADAIRARIDEIDQINAEVRDAVKYRGVVAELEESQRAHDAAQADIDAVETGKRDALASAVFPVDGLSIDDDGITYRGVPFSQVNSAARRSVAFAIATAGDPKLKLVVVKDGDLLDADSLAVIRKLADERGYTVLLERDRDESRAIGFTIEDGVLA